MSKRHIMHISESEDDTVSMSSDNESTAINETFFHTIIKKKGCLHIMIISFFLALGLGSIVAMVRSMNDEEHFVSMRVFDLSRT